MSTFRDRLIIEKEELDQKLDKLEAFRISTAFSEIDADQATLLNIQVHVMRSYSQILLERIVRLPKEEAVN